MLSIKERDLLVAAVSNMIQRSLTALGPSVSPDDVNNAIEGYFADDTAAADKTVTDKTVTPKGANIAATAAIAEWVADTPVVHNTLVKISGILDSQTSTNESVNQSLLDLGAALTALVDANDANDLAHSGYDQSISDLNSAITQQGNVNQNFSDALSAIDLAQTQQDSNISQAAQRLTALESFGLALPVDFITNPQMTAGPMTEFEPLPNGTYYGYASSNIITVDDAFPTELDPAFPGMLVINIRPYLLPSGTPEAGEENRKWINWEFRQGTLTYLRELDSLNDGTNLNWKVSGSGGAVTPPPSGSSDRLDLVDAVADSFFDTAAVRTKSLGVYTSRISKATAVAEFGYLGADEDVPILISIVDDTTEPAEKIVTYVLFASDAQITSTLRTFTDTKVTNKAAIEAEVIEGLDDVFNEFALAFSRMGLSVGDVITPWKDIVYSATSGALSESSIGFADDGTYQVYKHGVVVQRGYWMPYEGVASDYQIKRNDTVGVAHADTTLLDAFEVLTDNHLDNLVVAKQATSGNMSVTTEIIVRYIPTTTDSITSVTLTAIVT